MSRDFLFEPSWLFSPLPRTYLAGDCGFEGPDWKTVLGPLEEGLGELGSDSSRMASPKTIIYTNGFFELLTTASFASQTDLMVLN